MEVQHGFITQQMSFLSMSMPLSTNLTHLTYSATNQHLVQPLTLTPLHSMVNVGNQLVIKWMEKVVRGVLTRVPWGVLSCGCLVAVGFLSVFSSPHFLLLSAFLSYKESLSASITLSLATMLSALPTCQQVSISSVQVQQLVR